MASRERDIDAQKEKLEREVESHKEQVAELKKRADVAERRRAHAEERCAERNHEIAELTDKVSLLEGQRSALSIQLHSLSNESDSNPPSVGRPGDLEKITNLEARLVEHKTLIDTLKTEARAREARHCDKTMESLEAVASVSAESKRWQKKHDEIRTMLSDVTVHRDTVLEEASEKEAIIIDMESRRGVPW